MADITVFFMAFAVITTVAVVALAAILGTWAVQFFATNRRTRLAQHTPFMRYYRDLGQHAFVH